MITPPKPAACELSQANAGTQGSEATAPSESRVEVSEYR